MPSNRRGRNNNNPEGRNQFSNGWMESAKDRPFTSAAAAAAAVGAGVFLWSKRNQISDQISRLSDQITDWAGDMRSNGSGDEQEFAGEPTGSSATASRRSNGIGKGEIGSRTTARARRTTGRAEPQSTVM